MIEQRRKIICLTPVKNEEWILEKFLACASLWADHIIIADQGSTDSTVEIALNHPKVILVRNNNPLYNEQDRQKILLKEARLIEGPKILIALDADEVLVGIDQNEEWKTLLNAKPGTTFWMEWANVITGFNKYWSPNYPMLFGFVDDNSDHSGNFIHSPRVPSNGNEPKIFFSKIKVLHYQYIDWNRMKSKHRWYQCLERINDPKRSAISIYRQYHHMDNHTYEPTTIPPEWLEYYEKKSIDVSSINVKRPYWWDFEIINFIDQFGVKYFRKLAIWDYDWDSIHQLVHPQKKININTWAKRNFFHRLVHNWLKKSQANPYSLKNRIIHKFLRLVGW